MSVTDSLKDSDPINGRHRFPDEAKLHDLVEEAPHLLPLAGSPDLVIVGREVQLGSGYADLVAVESTGRLAVVELKLAKNAEARRAVVSQILSYAAYLYRLDPQSFERDILGSHLSKRGHDSLASAVKAADQEGSFDEAAFESEFKGSLREGRFRVVLVLDDAPEELVRLVGYLESVSDKLTVDLVTISSYQVGGDTVLVPQRVDPERTTTETVSASPKKPKGRMVLGAEDFVATIERMGSEKRPLLHRLAEWAMKLEAEGLARLFTYHGTIPRWTLLPRLQPENVGLVTIWNENGGHVQFWRSVFERKAPQSLKKVEACIAPDTVGQGNYANKVTDDLLDLLTDAYREANGKIE